MHRGKLALVGVWIATGWLTPQAAAVDLGLGLRAGTYGVGADFALGFNRWLGVRVAGSALDVSVEYEDSGFDSDGDLTLGGYGAFADFYPFRGGFRLSAGVLSNRNEISLSGSATESQVIGDGIYTPAEIGSLAGTVEFDDTAPYFGIGWGRFAGKKGLGFLFDLGVVDQGAGDVMLVSTTGTIAQDDLDQESAEIEDDIADYDLWPVVSFGLAIRF